MQQQKLLLQSYSKLRVWKFSLADVRIHRLPLFNMWPFLFGGVYERSFSD